MQINVAQLLRASLGAVREYTVDEAVDVLGNDDFRSVSGEVALLRTNRSILVRAKLESQVELECSRCLRSFACPVTVEFEEEYFPTIDVVSGMQLPPAEEPGGFIIDEHHVIDLTEAIRQYTLMGIPMKPLCRENCAGICPGCGQNLNVSGCNCPAEPADPRLARLEELLKSETE
jgi:uncharacterized protein